MQFPVCPELTRKNGLATLHRNQTHPNVLNDRGRLFKPTEPLLTPLVECKLVVCTQRLS